jgi:hypothetical protein
MLFELPNILFSLMGQKNEYILIILIIAIIYFLYNMMIATEEKVCPIEKVCPMCPTCQTNLCPDIIKENTTQRNYNKLDEITKPSNLTGDRGYIGKDQICYRSKLGDLDYMKKRPYCMACQVDKRKDGNVDYDGTYTNIMKTCLYADNYDPNDSNIWTKDKCLITCKDGKNMTNLI